MELTFYIGRDNAEELLLLQDGASVGNNAVTRAILCFGEFSLDTDTDTTIFTLEEEETQLKILGGKIANLTAGKFKGKLTVVNSDGDSLAWIALTINVLPWPTC